MERWRTVHVVPSFHSDAAYLEASEGHLSRAVDNLGAMIALARAQPEYTVAVEDVRLLEALVARHPDAEAELRALAGGGRLEIAGGMYVAPDANMPSGESLVRQAVAGQRWLEEHLGMRATTCWMAECWGLPRSLPGLLRHCGFARLVFRRGRPPGLSTSEFLWRGLDGGEILCHWMPSGYASVTPRGSGAGPSATEGGSPARSSSVHNIVEDAAAFAPTPHVLICDGVNAQVPMDVTAPDLDALGRAAGDGWRLIFSTPSRFFDAVEASGAELPVVEGEFNPVCQGTYSGRVALKQLNRRLESALCTAEKANAVLWLDGGTYPHAALAAAWRAVLVNQSHATIAGTVVDTAYQEAVDSYRAADRHTTRLVMDAVDRARDRRVGGHGGFGIFAFNPLPRTRVDVLRLNTMAIGWSSYRVTDAAGSELPAQASGNELAFLATLPPLGYVAFSLRSRAAATSPAATSEHPHLAPGAAAQGHAGAAPDAVETDHFRVRLRGGTIASLVDRRSGAEYVDPARPFWNDLILQHDHGDLWLLYDGPLNPRLRTTTPLDDPYPAETPGDDDRVDRSGVTAHAVTPTLELVDVGPVRTVIRARGTLRSGQISVDYVQHLTLYRALRRIDFRTELTGHGRRYRVRVAFPTPFVGGRIVHAIPFGQERRPEGEYPTQGWCAYGDDRAAVYLLNRGLPGANVTGGVLMLSLLRSAAMEEKGPSARGYEDGVRHTFSYSVIPATPASPVEPWWEADALNSPPIAIAAADVRPREEPRVRLEPGAVVLSALYLDGERLTARLHEAAGTACTATLWVAGLIACRETDALSTEGASLPVADETALLSFRSFEIKTLRLETRRPGR